ncbi:phage putative head morphogenesis protein, SPP1 gp7 family [Pseudomonas asplenii]|uniref:Phage putative head morphogenesis protein, SPP1 gp7 family n=1 Tax=Pseudomonas asplenii TaxID=53407 RepID=A0A0M9GBV7_9PSED|nr:phage minor head protein [Pseudomonas fuscovaginae]KPA87299.1 phage putative head morphogenesis protein, SPP1 gp7 family [Pseudomonas fuscovaginae]
MTIQPTILRPVRPNAGTQAWYRKRLDAAIKEMQDSLVFWLKANYRAAGLADGLAQDDSPAMMMRKAMNKLARRWQSKFDDLADTLSKKFADRALGNSDVSLRNAMEAAGATVKFTMTPEMNDVYQGCIGEQVGLIKSIASEHLTEVQGLVMRSVQRGRDLGSLTKDLERRYGITQRRAALIARDQNNKATSAMQSARQQALGIKEGIWRHSGGGKEPRHSHVKANGKKFDLAKGMFIDDEWIMPGEKINCRCTWSPVIPGFD